MQILIKSSNGADYESLAVDMHLFGYPAMLLDERMKIVSKNIECTHFVKGRVLGRRFTHFLNDEDKDLVEHLQIGDICYVSYQCNERPVNAGVTRLEGGYIAIFQPLGGGIIKRVSEKYSSLSGYDSLSTSPDMADIGFERFAKFSAAVEQLVEGRPRRRYLPFFNPRYFLSSLIGENADMKYPDGKSVNFVPNDEPITAGGNELDFVLTAAFALSYCLSVAPDGVTDAHIELCGEEVLLSVSCKKGGGDATLPDYWIRLLKLIADANLWDLSVISDEIHQAKFLLKMPYIEFGEEFIVREQPLDDVSRMFATLFLELISEDIEGFATHTSNKA